MPDSATVIGVDTGGTFTDAVVLTPDGRIIFEKSSTIPDDLTQSSIDVVEKAAETLGHSSAELLDRIDRYAHGTTIATNTLIEREGHQIGVVATAGFEDTSIIMRDGLGQSGGVPYHQALDYIHNERPDPLPAKEYIRGVTERVDAEGTVLRELDEAEMRQAVTELVDKGVESIAVNFLWSFKNPVNEERAIEIADDIVSDDVFLVRSSELSSIIGEYERSMTAIVNAYLGPTMESYVNELDARISEAGLTDTDLQLMKCTGGLSSAEQASRNAVSLIDSGPVGGLVASKQLGQVLGHGNIITTDMGGTSFDVGVIREGEFTVENTPFVDKGIPVQIPAVEIETVGAGGGSIVWTRGNRLRVGPKSTGAYPGPACYGRGGDEPTITDALLLLGFLNPDNFLGGDMSLDVDAAERAFESVADEIGMDVGDAVMGTYEIATSKMADLIRKVTVERGYDPREFTLYAFGGAGPAHAAVFGQELGVNEVVVPRGASTFSAFGIAFADIQREYARTSTTSLAEATTEELTEIYARLEEEATGEVGSLEGYTPTYGVELRYVEQMNQLLIETSRSPDIAALEEKFNRTYEERFGEGASLGSSEIEAITFHLNITKPTAEPRFPERTAVDQEVPVGSREMVFPTYGEVEGDTLTEEALLAHEHVTGPAVIEKPQTTIVVPPETRAELDDIGNLVLRWD